MAHQLDDRLHKLCKQGNLQGAKEFMDTCNNLPLWLAHTVGMYGYTPMHEAASKNRSKVLELLLQYGGDVNCRANMYSKCTPLHLAASGGHVDCVRVLIANSADVNIPDIYGRTPIESAKYSRQHAVTKVLKSAGSCWTHEEFNQGYMDGMLPSSDARVVLLGHEGSGKTCLSDTLVGKHFKEDTTPTQGADQFEISVTTAANWELMNDSEKLNIVGKQVFLEIEFYLASSPPSMNGNHPVARANSGVFSYFLNLLSSPRTKTFQLHKGFAPISTEEFQQLQALQERYDPEKKYIHLWDFAGQQVFQHTHGLFLSDEVVCLFIFNAGKSLYDIPDHRYPDDITPSKSGVESICHWMEVVSARVSHESTSKDDLSKLLPTYVLVATHIDELHEDITVAKKIAFDMIVPVLLKELEGKPFLNHIAGSKNSKLFTEESPSIFFMSNKKRDPAVINQLKKVITKIAFANKQPRPIRYLKMERKILHLAYKDRVSVITLSQGKEIAESCGLSDSEKLETLQYLHQKGTLLYFAEVPDIIILSPNWLAKLLTYALTTLKCYPRKFPLNIHAEMLRKEGLLEEQLLQWSIEQFLEAEADQKIPLITPQQTAQLFINFKLMADVTSSSLANKQSQIEQRKENERLYLVPHLLPKETDITLTKPCYRFLYHFPGGFISEVVFNQVVVMCAEWNGNHHYDLIKVSYQHVHLELGDTQTYVVRPLHEAKVIELSIFRYTANADDGEANADTVELVYILQQFINDALEQHMKAFHKFPICSYIPCSKCDHLHIKFEKAKTCSVVPCNTTVHTKCDITKYHKLFLNTTGAPAGNPLLPAEVSESTPMDLDKEPVMKDLRKIAIPSIASEWKIVADFLDYDIPIINLFAATGKEDPMKCCIELFTDWLSTDNGRKPKTWSTLIETLKTIPQLSGVAEHIEKLLKCETTVSIALPNLRGILALPPKMKELHQFVIPHIAAYWREVADYLKYTIGVIKTIKEKYNYDPAKCCDELFRNWLCTSNGVEPKTWSTLINTLKDIKDLEEVAKKIEQQITKIYKR
ncbi:uncharacterized protein [Dysidea avara]|uniref:uncharacterized protein isoform X2 n=1 Tax=Dysidea avara TaxID=196820 RepID=UPI0033304F14